MTAALTPLENRQSRVYFPFSVEYFGASILKAYVALVLVGPDGTVTSVERDRSGSRRHSRSHTFAYIP